MKDFIKKIWGRITTFLSKIGCDKCYHFIVGLVVAAFFCITLKWSYWSIIPVAVIAALKEFCDLRLYGKYDWMDFIATCLGGLIIILCIII